MKSQKSVRIITVAKPFKSVIMAGVYQMTVCALVLYYSSHTDQRYYKDGKCRWNAPFGVDDNLYDTCILQPLSVGGACMHTHTYTYYKPPCFT